MPSPRLSAVVSPRLSKLIGDVNKFLDDNSTSATSFLSESFMNLSMSNHSHSASASGGSGYFSTGNTRRSCSGRRRRCPSDICVEDFDDFVSNILPEFVQDKNLAAMLQYGVQNYLPNACPSSLAEIEHYLTTILESTPSLPAPVVADLHSYRGLVNLKQGDHNVAAVESFTRALWLQSHLMRLASDEQEELERLLDMALTEHRLGVAYGRNKQYLEAIDQMKYAIQSYERAQVGISESCYVSAKEDLHEFTEARQLSLLKSSGRVMRRSQLRRCKSADGSDQNSPLRRCKSDQTTRGARRPQPAETLPEDNVPVEVELSREDSFSY